ncbi:MAG: sigma-54 dependent transcriptional regulator [Spirochaetota bacterium]|nr:sigma-54 dependent transcriptional regulator [Spirochaetota bacterium]
MHEKMRILLIDDEPVVCGSCERFLGEEGYEIKTTLKGKEGIELIKNNEFDIVITDLKMPEISGMDILEFTKKNYPEIQVIIITGYSTISNAVESIKKGAFDYLPKPFTPDELLSVVRDASIKRMQSLKHIYRCKVTPHKYGLDNIIGISDEMIRIFELIEKIAPTDSTVLITGESGTGKELIARAIYNHSSRKDMHFIPVDCSTLAESLLESELFGHTKGSFTGASTGKRGLFEIADNGTLFLDEVSNIPMDTQKKLLRVLESREFRPVGSEKVKRVDIRLIAATNRNLKMMIEKEKFREDLYYRLNVFSIDVPPLRKRPEDIPILAYNFLRQICQTLDKRPKEFSKEAMDIMMKYNWPGNVRELRNAIERLVIISDDDLLSSENINNIIDIDENSISNNTNKYSAPMTNIELKENKKKARENAVIEVEKTFVIEALTRNKWNVTKAAEDTGMQRTNFQALMKKYNIKHQDP